MYSTNEFRKGLKVEIDGQAYIMVDCQFVKPGKGNAFTRTKLKNMVTGAVLDRTYKSGEKLGKAHLVETVMQYLYAQDDTFHFMNTTTYEQIEIPREALGDAPKWLYENLEVEVLFHSGKPISINLPNFVELKVSECDPGVKGNSATGRTKPATLQTGLVVQVPEYLAQGERIKVDTRSGDFISRA